MAKNEISVAKFHKTALIILQRGLGKHAIYKTLLSSYESLMSSLLVERRFK